MKWGLTLILPGALGNLLDRILHRPWRRGLHQDRGFRYLYWPIFNMADVYVTVGVGLFLSIFCRKIQPEAARHSS